MNCTQVEKLLALYVEDDLAEARASAVAAHLQACHGCRRLADEFEASQNVLRHYTPPHFDDAFFDDIRQSVLREITRAPARRGFIEPLKQLFAPRSFAFAAALALLLTAGAFGAFQLYRRITPETPNTVANKNPSVNSNDARPGTAVANSPEETQPPPSSSTGIAVTENAQDERAQNPRAASPKPSRERRRHASPPVSTGASTLEQAINAPPREEGALSINQTTAQVTTAQGTAPFAPEAVAKMTRIELQTSDPNVRIIWFSPQTTDTLSTRK